MVPFILSSFSPMIIPSSGGYGRSKTRRQSRFFNSTPGGGDHFTNGYRLRTDYINHPLGYKSLNFIDEELLYIERGDQSVLRGFYKIIENEGVNGEDIPLYIRLEDKNTNLYYFPLRPRGEQGYEINYLLELGRQESLLQIWCLGRMEKKEAQK